MPKGVALSHRNINANRHQTAARISFTSSDVVLNALPMFHAFGLTVGTLLRVLSGLRTFLYPRRCTTDHPGARYGSPPRSSFGTDQRSSPATPGNAHPYDFYSIRYV